MNASTNPNSEQNANTSVAYERNKQTCRTNCRSKLFSHSATETNVRIKQKHKITNTIETRKQIGRGETTVGNNRMQLTLKPERSQYHPDANYERRTQFPERRTQFKSNPAGNAITQARDIHRKETNY